MRHDDPVAQLEAEGLTVGEIDQELLFRQLAAVELRMFLRYRARMEGWKLVWGWYLDLACEYLEAQERREVPNLILNWPPGTLKSITLQTWHAWMIGRRDGPESSVLSCANNAELAERDSEATRGILQSEWMRNIFPTFGLDPQTGRPGRWGKDRLRNWSTPGRALRQAVGQGAKCTGLGARRLVVDDLMAVEDANSDVKRERAIRWYRETLTTRARQPNPTKTLVMQRLHELDLTGVLDEDQELGGEGWVKVELPMESERTRVYSFGRVFHLRQSGELLCPELYPARRLSDLKVSLRAGYSGQYNQRPTKMEGNLLAVKRLIVVDQTPEKLIAEMGLRPSFYLDFATKEKQLADDDPDYNVLTVWAKDEVGRLFKLWQWAEQCDLGQFARVVVMAHRKWKPVWVKGEKGALINVFQPILRMVGKELDHQVVVEGITIDGDKVARAGPLRGALALDQVHVVKAPWNVDMKLQYASFPNGAHNDIVDADAYAVADQQALQKPEEGKRRMLPGSAAELRRQLEEEARRASP